jgi:hypothetical protein
MYYMFFYKLFLIVVFVSINMSAQTLFEDSLVSKPIVSEPKTVSALNETTVLAGADSVMPTIIKKKNTVRRLIGTNLESVITKGDIQVQYEIPQSNYWSTVVLLHVNPHESFNDKTGDFGAFVGGRMYLDGSSVHSPLYMQAFFGFNHFSSWDLALSFDIGKQIQWKENVFFEFAANVSRFYAPSMPDPEISVKAGLTYGLDTRLLPFL